MEEVGEDVEEEEVSSAAEEQLKSWESLAVICAFVPVSGCVHNRYDVEQRANVVLCVAPHHHPLHFPPTLPSPKWEMIH